MSEADKAITFRWISESPFFWETSLGTCVLGHAVDQKRKCYRVPALLQQTEKVTLAYERHFVYRYEYVQSTRHFNTMSSKWSALIAQKHLLQVNLIESSLKQPHQCQLSSDPNFPRCGCVRKVSSSAREQTLRARFLVGQKRTH